MGRGAAIERRCLGTYLQLVPVGERDIFAPVSASVQIQSLVQVEKAIYMPP